MSETKQTVKKDLTLFCSIPGSGDSGIADHVLQSSGCTGGIVDTNTWNREIREMGERLGAIHGLYRIENIREGKNVIQVKKIISLTKEQKATKIKEISEKYKTFLADDSVLCRIDSATYSGEYGLAYFFAALDSEKYAQTLKDFYCHNVLKGAEFSEEAFQDYKDNIKYTLLTVGKDSAKIREACGGDPIGEFGPFRLLVEVAGWGTAVRTGYVQKCLEDGKGLRLSGSFLQYSQCVDLIEDLCQPVDKITGKDYSEKASSSLDKSQVKFIVGKVNTNDDNIKKIIKAEAFQNIQYTANSCSGYNRRGRYEGLIRNQLMLLQLQQNFEKFDRPEQLKAYLNLNKQTVEPKIAQDLYDYTLGTNKNDQIDDRVQCMYEYCTESAKKHYDDVSRLLEEKQLEYERLQDKAKTTELSAEEKRTKLRIEGLRDKFSTIKANTLSLDEQLIADQKRYDYIESNCTLAKHKGFNVTVVPAETINEAIAKASQSTEPFALEEVIADTIYQSVPATVPTLASIATPARSVEGQSLMARCCCIQ